MNGREKRRVLKEKLNYLLNIELREKKFNLLDFQLEISDYTPRTTQSEEPTTLIEEYTIFLVVDYDSRLDSSDPYTFVSDLKFMLNKLRECVSQYTILENGKVVMGNEKVRVSEPFITKIEYEIESIHKFYVDFRFDYID